MRVYGCAQARIRLLTRSTIYDDHWLSAVQRSVLLIEAQSTHPRYQEPFHAPKSHARNRRNYQRDAIKAAGAAGVAVGRVNAVKAEAPAFLKSVHAANNQINYGIIGTGGRGQYLLGLLKSVDNGKCIAICDIDDENLNKGLSSIGGSPKTYKDYRQLLADSSVEAVLIATPVYLHYPMLEDALKAGKHVFCEKSLVFTPEEVHKAARDVSLAVSQAGSASRFAAALQRVLSSREADDRQRSARRCEVHVCPVASQPGLGDEAGELAIVPQDIRRLGGGTRISPLRCCRLDVWISARNGDGTRRSRHDLRWSRYLRQHPS